MLGKHGALLGLARGSMRVGELGLPADVRVPQLELVDLALALAA